MHKSFDLLHLDELHRKASNRKSFLNTALKTIWAKTKRKELILFLTNGLLSFILLYAGLAKFWNPESTEAYVYVLDSHFYHLVCVGDTSLG